MFSLLYRISRKIPGGSILLRLLYGCEIPRKASIHETAYFNHNALGVVIHPAAMIGENAYIEHHVCLGQKNGDEYEAPIVCKDCVIGAYSILLGGITIGEGSVIGAGSLVLEDVPAHSVFINKRLCSISVNTKEKGKY